MSPRSVRNHPRSTVLASIARRAAVGSASMAVLLASACAPPNPMHDSGGAIDVVVSCTALALTPDRVRVATGDALQLRAVGGSGMASFALEGDAQGSVIEPGGGLRAGPTAAMFTAIARDGLCHSEARATIEVVGPFNVQPAMTRLDPGQSLTYVPTGALDRVEYAVLSRPTGMGTPGTVNAAGVFSAGTIVGSYDLVARDTGSGREQRLAVDVGTGTPLRPRSRIVAVPIGGRVPLDWRGGSGNFDTRVTGDAGGRFVLEGTQMFFDAAGARVGFSDVDVTDRFTRETSSVRVLISDAIGTIPIPRGGQTQLGDMGTGDVNSDGHTDLVVGHAERSVIGLEAGGLLVFYGTAAGGFGERPDVVIEGGRTRDRFGSVVLVRDMNGDSIDDVIVGAPEQDLGENDRGAVTLYLGSRAGLVTTPERGLVGEDANNRFGTALIAQDINGDRMPDLVVSAPNAVNPLARACIGGRVYVFRSRAGVRGVVEAIPSQVIDLRDTLSDDPEGVIPCSSTPLNAGRALALIDMDGDRFLDLVVGAPQVSIGTPNRGQGAVLIYRGSMSGQFESTPAWSIHEEMQYRIDNTFFGSGLDVVSDSAGGPAVLVVRSPSITARNAMAMPVASAGGLWVFTPGTLGAPGTPGTVDGGMVARARNVTTAIATATYFGAVNRGIGRSGQLGDLDRDGHNDYIVGSAASGAPGSVQIFSAASVISARGILVPALELTHMGNELQGFRVAVLQGMTSGPAGLASWAAWRTTAQGLYVGAIDYVPPGTALTAARWGMRTGLLLPAFGASDRSGTTLAMGDLNPRGTMDALIGAPGAHSPAVTGTTPRPAGDRQRAGAVEIVPTGTATATAHLWVDRTDGALGTNPVAVLDFDGDGSLDFAVGDATESAGTTPAMGYVNPDGCLVMNAMGAPAAVGSRGVVRVYLMTATGPVERFRLTSSSEMARMDTALPYLKNRFGFSLGVADTNGDGLDDLIVGRTGTADGTGAEVVLGRRYTDAMNRIQIACNTGDAIVIPPTQPGQLTIHGSAVAGIGDLDRDGCDEIAASITRSAASGAVLRAGVIVAFGYGGLGACGGHDRPFTIRIVADDRPLINNSLAVGTEALRADDDMDLPGSATGMGATLAGGRGDVTGDGVPDLVFRDSQLSFRLLSGPAVEIISGAYIAGLCPARVCPQGRPGTFWADGDYRVLGLRTVSFPNRRVIAAPATIAARFASSIFVGDITGDAFAEIAVGSPDDSLANPFAGVVRVFRGGAATTTQDALLDDPWLLAVGDVSERSAFGTAVSTSQSTAAGAWLGVGAPASNRNGAGGEIGAVYRWRVEVPR